MKNTKDITNFLNLCDPEMEYSESEVERILPLLERNNVTQIINSFDIRTTLCLLKMYEDQENYEICNIIKSKIEIHNKINNTEYKTHL